MNRHVCVLMVLAVSYIGCGDSDDNDIDDAKQKNSLSVITEEPAGANCANGGIRVAYGLDTDGNGTLQDTEFTSTQYVCKDSTHTLITTTAESVGSNCSYGGTKISVGNDTNGNGTLDADEATSTSYVCETDPKSGWYYGDYYVRTAADVDALADYKYIQGSLYVENTPANTTELTIPYIELITEEVYVYCPEANIDVTFSALKQASYVEAYAYCGVNTIALHYPVLTNASSGVYLYGQYLTTFDAPQLQAAQYLQVSNTGLADLSLPSLTSVQSGYIQIYSNPSLDQCDVFAILNALEARQDLSSVNTSNNGAECTDLEIMAPFITIDNDSTHYRWLWSQQSWADARTTCQSFGSGWDLAVFSSATEIAAVGNSYFATDNNFWFGYSDAASEGTWVWAQSTGSAYAPQPGDADFWDASQPDNAGGNENCAQFLNSGTSLAVNDADCATTMRSLCRLVDAP